MPLDVIGAGVGRTGTHSLKLALERLGFGPTHHMEEVIKDVPRHAPAWQKAAEGDANWEELYKGYRSAVDWPTASFFRELHAAYPKAKFVISARTAESWYDSFSQTIFTLMQGADQAPPPMQPFMAMGKKVLGKAGFYGPTTKDELIAAYNAHLAAVKATVPEKQLLVFDYRDGWAPLCNFLGVAVPDEPFPKSNNREDFWERIKKGPPGH